MGEEEVQLYIDTLIDNRIIAKYFSKRIQENRLAVIKELGNIHSHCSFTTAISSTTTYVILTSYM